MAEKPRSTAQHRRFFSVVAAAFDHWPESHPFQPENPEHLRAYLLVRAKHSIIKTFIMSGDASEAAQLVPFVFASMARQHSWAKAVGNELHVCIPDSIAYDKCPHQLFCKVSDDVENVLRTEAGLEPDELLKMKEAA